MDNKLTLSWGQRFALISAYSPSDEQIQKTFKITKEELSAARDCFETGTFREDSHFDTTAVGNVFENPNVEIIGGAATGAVQQKSPAKTRGRKGDNIINAFSSIPTTPIPATKFAEERNVSLAVLRQAKRFDKTGKPGAVRVKKMADGDSKTLMIWREEA